MPIMATFHPRFDKGKATDTRHGFDLRCLHSYLYKTQRLLILPLKKLILIHKNFPVSSTKAEEHHSCYLIVRFYKNASVSIIADNKNLLYSMYQNPSATTMHRLDDLKKTKLRGLSPRANYTDRAAAACRRSDCQLVQIEGAKWSA
jgi:hypothetical protein